ncbi:unnamed protein product [Amaranthus hypochondriacus]
MSASYNSCQTSLYKMNENHDLIQNPVEKQSIVCILSSESDFNSTQNNNSCFSIRRTLSSTDMSSPKWLQNNGFPLKRVQSSHQLQVLGESDAHHDHDHDLDLDHDNTNNNKGAAFEQIWSSIQADKRSWNSILSPLNNDGSGSGSGSGADSLTPYVHPLTKRSTSSLSEKSLEICTESLGSETGSDGFSYSSSSEGEDLSDKEQDKEETIKEEYSISIRCNNAEMGNFKYSSPNKRSSMMAPPSRPSFPPPLPSLSHRDDGSNLHIRSHRQDGRLVVEAVSVPNNNCFRAQRQDGRLLLTLAINKNGGNEDENRVEEEEEKETITDESLVIQKPCTPTLTMSKLTVFTKTRNYNTTIIKTLDELQHNHDQVTAIKTATVATAAMNAYEYYWRRSTTAMAVLKPFAGKNNNNNNKNIIYGAELGKDDDIKKNNKKMIIAAHNKKEEEDEEEEEEVVVVKAGGRRRGSEEKEEYLVPFMFKGCKQHKKSLFFFEPYCIAT